MTEEITQKCSSTYVPYSITSFKDLDAIEAAREESAALSDLLSAFQQMMGNIMYAADIDDKGAAITALATELTKRMKSAGSMSDKELKALYPDHTKSPIKRENGLDFPARDYAYVPDPALPSTWALRIAETPGQITEAQLGKAAALLSPGAAGATPIPTATLSAVKRRIRSEYRKLHINDSEIPTSVRKSFMTWKDKATGLIRWLATYSNNYRDRDNPSEIISEKSHKTFVELVRKGIVDYPELWHWHIPGTVWGKATWVDYVDGFALASGTVYPGYEQQAENLSKMADIRVSHGMPSALIQRNKADSSIIDFHVTTEISPLPGWAAANELTDFLVIDPQEQDMFTTEQKTYLASIGLDEKSVSLLEDGLQSKAAAAAALGTESKAKKPTDEEAAAAAKEDAADGGADDDEEDASGKKKPPMKKELTTKDIADAVSGALAPLLVGLQELGKRQVTLEDQVKALSASDSEKIAKAAKQTPALSLQSLIEQSVLGQDAARLDGRSSLAKSGPKETVTPVAGATGIGFLDTLLSGGAQNG